MKNRIEILSPAGGVESLQAAVRSGADAVYLGAKDFSARASAQNFSQEELSDAIGYCRERGVKVYLTLNTLMFDSDIESAVALASYAYTAGIDAVIVQDIGLASILRKHIPDLRLHGSTQMSIHTPSGAKALWEMGFSRVVLSRELSLKEIQEIAESCPIELEVFVHGALCMSVSGQCYFSAMLGGRSGNRGMCAQPCRLPFSLNSGSDHALSLKDNSLIDYLPQLEAIGVTSAKIEGRMRRPEYVSAAVSACKEKLWEGQVSPLTRDRLEGVFSRTGFTDGYLRGKRDGNMFGYRRKEDVTAAGEGLLRDIRNTYKNELQRVEIDFNFCAETDNYPTLTISDGTNTLCVTGDSLTEKARTLPLQEEKVTTLLSKTGGTPYKVRDISCHIGQNLSLPVSKINELRRQALEQLSEIRRAPGRTAPKGYKYIVEKTKEIRRPTRSRARFTDTDIPKQFKDCEMVFVPVTSKQAELKRLQSEGFTLGVEIPRGMFGRERALREHLLTASALGINHALVSNIGAVYLAKELGFKLHGGFGLNLTNTAALLWAQEWELEDVELSFELTQEQISRLGAQIPRGIIAAGYLPLMLTRCCPGYTTQGGCRGCDKHQILQDRMGKKFIFTCDGNCTEILNCVPLLIPDKINDFWGIDFYDFRFTVENSVEKVENIRRFSSKNQNLKDFTRGLYYRGIK